MASEAEAQKVSVALPGLMNTTDCAVADMQMAAHAAATHKPKDLA
jgi:hypothetical protein